MEWLQFEQIVRELGYTPYSASKNTHENTLCMMVRNDASKKLAVAGDGAMFSGEDLGFGIKLCELSIENAHALMQLFPFTKPQSCKGHAFTIGLGDRLGCATAGLVRSLEGKDVFPILAQQSIRELNLTGRNYLQVIADAAFGVFQGGYRSGYGADGDHLKKKEEIKYALDSGCTMVTLDCSEHIRNEAAKFSEYEIKSAYEKVPEHIRSHYEKRYLSKEHPVIGEIRDIELKRTVLIFSEAVLFAIDCYRYMQSIAGLNVDFELSIDEATAITTPVEHFVIATELEEAGVKPNSLAPHFVGEFEKGIEYQGDLEQFAVEVKQHQKIAEIYGYKLSLHSGSDKYSVFPVFAAITKGNMHVKTAGTHWLEAVRVMACKKPELYRIAQKYALEHYADAAKYYHVSSDPNSIQNIDFLSDAYLPELLNLSASRQLMHIAYGVLLAQPWFREAFFHLIHDEECLYHQFLQEHIDKHFRYLLETKPLSL